MEIKIKFSDNDKRVLKRTLASILSVSFMITGIYAVCYLEKLGLIKGQIQIVPVLLLHLLQWYLVMRLVFKHYWNN